MIPKLADEIALVVRMKSLGVECDAFNGLTTVEQRMDYIREALEPILEETYAELNGKRITMALEYARIYGAVP